MDGADGIGKIDRTGSDQGGILAQTVSGHQVRNDPPLGKGRVKRDAGAQNGRLGIGGQTEFFLGPLKTEAGQGKAEGLIRLGEDLLCTWVHFGEILPHPDLLGSLAWKEKSDFSHFSPLLSISIRHVSIDHFSTAAPQVSPPPKPTRTSVFPFLMRPWCSASSKATGMDADDMFPKRSRLMITFSSDRPKRLTAASMMRMLA